jgi:hypothetical protein
MARGRQGRQNVGALRSARRAMTVRLFPPLLLFLSFKAHFYHKWCRSFADMDADDEFEYDVDEFTAEDFRCLDEIEAQYAGVFFRPSSLNGTYDLIFQVTLSSLPTASHPPLVQTSGSSPVRDVSRTASRMYL